MSRAARELRQVLDAFYGGEQGFALSRMRDPSLAAAPASRGLGKRLCASYGADLCAEIRELAEDTPDEVAWLQRHVQRMPHTLALLDAERGARATLSDLMAENGAPLILREQLARISQAADARHRGEASRELDRALRDFSTQRAAQVLRSERLLFVERARTEQSETPSATPARSGLLIVSAFDPGFMEAARDLPDEPWHADAREFLARTEDAAEDAVGFLMRSVARGDARDLPGLTYALRAAELDSDLGRKRRWSRTSEWLSALGFTRDLQAHVHTESDLDAFDPRASIALLQVPRDIRLAQSPLDFGCMSDVCAAEGVARALGHALVHTALPSELRWPLGPSTTGTLGALGALVWCDRVQLERIQHLASAQVERVARLCGTFILLQARATVALALMPGSDTESADARLEAACEAVATALRVRVSPGLVALLLSDRAVLRARALEQLSAFATAVGLRERHDSDWFRNPRSASFLRGMVQGGNSVDPVQLCAEHGLVLASAGPRASELVA